MTDEQIKSLKVIHARWEIEDDFETFKSKAQPMLGGDRCVMVNVGSMWLGVETDGYTHS